MTRGFVPYEMPRDQTIQSGPQALGKSLSYCLFKSCSHRSKIEVLPSLPFLTIAYTSCAVIFGHVLAGWNPKGLGVGCVVTSQMGHMNQATDTIGHGLGPAGTLATGVLYGCRSVTKGSRELSVFLTEPGLNPMHDCVPQKFPRPFADNSLARS